MTEQDAGNQMIEDSMMFDIPNEEGMDYCSVANYVLERNDGLVGDEKPPSELHEDLLRHAE